MQISALEVWHVNNEENNSQTCSLESGSADENIETSQKDYWLLKISIKNSKSQGKNQVIFARKILECLT